MAARRAREAAPERRRSSRRMLRIGAGPAGPPLTDEGRAVYFMIADAQGPHPESVGLGTVSRQVFAGQKVRRPALTEGEIETLEILADPNAVRQLRLAARDVREGRLVEWKNRNAKNVK